MRPSPGAEDDGGNGDSIAEACCDDEEEEKIRARDQRGFPWGQTVSNNVSILTQNHDIYLVVK
jgi:hypothetical protein